MTSRAALQASLAGRLGSPNEARWMVEEVLGERDDADEGALAALDAMADRRARGEPLQYVLGTWAFRTLELVVDPRALIPRPETEQVVEVALVEARRQLAGFTEAPSADTTFLVADVGTGSGAIALSLAVELPSNQQGTADLPDRSGLPDLGVIASDIDPSALELAAVNRARVDEAHPGVAGAVELVQGRWFEAFPADLRGRFHLVVSNPPYVSEEEWDGLDPEVRLEPYGALVAGAGSNGTPGFAGVEAVLCGAVDWLAPGGAVVVEMAPQHAPHALDLAASAGYVAVRVEQDLAGRPRTVVARVA